MNDRWLLIDDLRELNCDRNARTPEEARIALREEPWAVLCLDHDLGTDETGYDVLVWGLNEGLIPPMVQLVTSNPVGRGNMRRALESSGYSTTDGINFRK